MIMASDTRFIVRSQFWPRIAREKAARVRSRLAPWDGIRPNGRCPFPLSPQNAIMTALCQPQSCPIQDEPEREPHSIAR